MVGLLYLDNTLIAGAFTPERVSVLQALASQAAISLENAQLYAKLTDYNRTLEEKVVQRTHELQGANLRLEGMLKFARFLQHELKGYAGSIEGLLPLLQQRLLTPATAAEFPPLGALRGMVSEMKEILLGLSSKAGGSGLGLALIERVARLHGGSFTFGNRTDRRGGWVELRFSAVTATSVDDPTSLARRLPT